MGVDDAGTVSQVPVAQVPVSTATSFTSAATSRVRGPGGQFPEGETGTPLSHHTAPMSNSTRSTLTSATSTLTSVSSHVRQSHPDAVPVPGESSPVYPIYAESNNVTQSRASQRPNMASGGPQLAPGSTPLVTSSPHPVLPRSPPQSTPLTSSVGSTYRASAPSSATSPSRTGRISSISDDAHHEPSTPHRNATGTCRPKRATPTVKIPLSSESVMEFDCGFDLQIDKMSLLQSFRDASRRLGQMKLITKLVKVGGGFEKLDVRVHRGNMIKAYRCFCDKASAKEDVQSESLIKNYNIRSVECHICHQHDHSLCALAYQRTLPVPDLPEIKKRYLCYCCRIACLEPFSTVKFLFDLWLTPRPSRLPQGPTRTGIKGQPEKIPTLQVISRILQVGPPHDQKATFLEMKNMQTHFVEIRCFALDENFPRFSKYPLGLVFKIAPKRARKLSELEWKSIRPFYEVSAPEQFKTRLDAPFTVPWDLLTGDQMEVLVELTYQSATDPQFMLGLVLVERLGPENIAKQISGYAKLGPQAGSEVAARMIRPPTDADDDDGDEVIDVYDCHTLDLRCPNTRQRPEVPARSIRCLHVQCFDLGWFVNHPAKFHFQRWKCPYCNKSALPCEIIVDEFVQEILTHTSKRDIVVFLSLAEQSEPSVKCASPQRAVKWKVTVTDEEDTSPTMRPTMSEGDRSAAAIPAQSLPIAAPQSVEIIDSD
eukprot:GHVN01015885.1.p1 GENE.GHVN01015885.1~~GHVN01015885.1.p1  ORF type:complete len:831 (+),score=219.54 GHVN01015885.1:362-2494(+)